MKAVSSGTTAAWLSGDYTGARRPMTRVTVQRMHVVLTRYDLDADQILIDSVVSKRGKFASIPFGQVHQPVELPNLASMKWARDVDNPVATATLEFFNSQPYPLGVVPDDGDVLDQPGFFTYNRGVEDFSTPWGFSDNGWRGLLVPDVILRTYEGYGFNASVAPEVDDHMNPSGLWIVDEVQYTTGGMIRVQARDIGRALQDHIAFPPVVPWAEYPLSWEAFRQEANPPKFAAATGWVRPRWQTDSNQDYRDAGFTDGGRPYVDPDGAVRGHHGRDAFDNSAASYWLSVGNEAWWSSAYEYVQGTIAPADVGAVRVRVHGGSYRGFVSVKVDGVWKGSKKIPYVARAVDTGANIRYVKAFTVGKNGTAVIKLPKVYGDVEAVRITFTDLWNSGIGSEFPYRAGVRDVQVSAANLQEVDAGTHTEGNYGDYTDIVKWFCAWGGLFWPMAASGNATVKWSDGSLHTIAPGIGDPVFPATPGGRVWGDFMDTGTNGAKATLGVELWDKKPLLDCIAYIRDIVNFILLFGEDGAVIWRQPNIWKVGNYIYDPMGQSAVYVEGSEGITELTDETVITDMTAKLSSRNMRESVFVGNVAGNFGAVAHGFIPSGTRKSGLRRVGGWTDQRFESVEECQTMADLITLRQMQSYRENTVTIAAYPGIQVDDQVRLRERVTNENFLHYVKGIQSDWTLRTGKWTYQLTTQWLGETPGVRWAFDPAQLSAETQRYLYALGMVTTVLGQSEYETEVLDAGATETGMIELPRTSAGSAFHIKKVKSDRQVRVRLYDTAAHRNADEGRAFTAQNPSGVDGLIIDCRTERESSPALEVQFDPDVPGSSATMKVPITVTNRSGARRSVKVTVKWRVP